jgi:hypothetical protein
MYTSQRIQMYGLMNAGAADPTCVPVEEGDIQAETLCGIYLAFEGADVLRNIWFMAGFRVRGQERIPATPHGAAREDDWHPPEAVFLQQQCAHGHV